MGRGVSSIKYLIIVWYSMSSRACSARLEKLAEHALEDTDYQTMIKYLMDDTPLDEMDKHSELFLMGSERQYMSTFKCNNGCSLVVKNGEEVVIPKGARDAVLDEMHAT